MPGNLGHLLFLSLAISLFERQFFCFFGQPLSLLLLKLLLERLHPLLGQLGQLVTLSEGQLLQHRHTGIVTRAQIVLPLFLNKDLPKHLFNAVFGALRIFDVKVFHHLLFGVQRCIRKLDQFCSQCKDRIVVFSLLRLGFFARQREDLRSEDCRGELVKEGVPYREHVGSLHMRIYGLFGGILIALLLPSSFYFCNFFGLRAIHRDVFYTQVTVRDNKLVFFIILIRVIGHLVIIIFVLTHIFTILFGPLLFRIHFIVDQFVVFAEWRPTCQQGGLFFESDAVESPEGVFNDNVLGATGGLFLLGSIRLPKQRLLLVNVNLLDCFVKVYEGFHALYEEGGAVEWAEKSAGS